MNQRTTRQTTRREALCQAGTGLGMLGLAGLLGDTGYLGDARGGTGATDAAKSGSPLRGSLEPRLPHFPARAKHVIHIYLNGGPSQVDTFDPKPLLKKYEGKVLPHGNLTTERKTGTALASPFKFRKYGQSGIEVSEIFARTAQHVDDLCVIRSMHANTPNHEQSMRLMNCGDERLSRPSMGAWTTYGLGTENQNLPGFIAMCPGLPVADVSNWCAAFLPGVYQGTYIDTRRTKVEDLIENIHNATVTPADQRRQLDLLAELNRRHLAERSEDDTLDARIASFELAYRMQMAATDAFDVEQEPRYVRDAYGPGVQARAALDCSPPGRAGSAVRAALSRRASAVGQPRPDRGRPPQPGPGLRSGHRGAFDGSQAARASRRDAGPLRRRVRANPGRRDDQRPAGHGPRPQSLGLFGLAGRRRRQRGHGPRRHR